MKTRAVRSNLLLPADLRISVFGILDSESGIQDSNFIFHGLNWSDRISRANKSINDHNKRLCAAVAAVAPRGRLSRCVFGARNSFGTL